MFGFPILKKYSLHHNIERKKNIQTEFTLCVLLYIKDKRKLLFAFVQNCFICAKTKFCFFPSFFHITINSSQRKVSKNELRFHHRVFAYVWFSFWSTHCSTSMSIQMTWALYMFWFRVIKLQSLNQSKKKFWTVNTSLPSLFEHIWGNLNHILTEKVYSIDWFFFELLDCMKRKKRWKVNDPSNESRAHKKRKTS